MNFRGAGANVIGDAQAAAPSVRSYAAGQCREKRLGIRIRNRQDRDFRNCRSVFDLQALGVFGCANARGERVTGIKRHVGDAAALDAIGRAVGPGRESLSLDESIFMRIGKYQAADGPVLGRDFGLDTAPGMIVASDDNLSLDRYAQAIELLVVFRDAVVDVDQRSAHVAVDGVSVVGGKLLGLLIGRGILRNGWFLELSYELRAALDELDEAFLGRGEENVKLFDVRVETELLEF